mgnify:CR=1 FL=1
MTQMPLQQLEDCKQTLKEFQQDCNLNVDIAATMPTEKYNRFMIIGHKK